MAKIIFDFAIDLGGYIFWVIGLGFIAVNAWYSLWVILLKPRVGDLLLLLRLPFMKKETVQEYYEASIKFNNLKRFKNRLTTKPIVWVMKYRLKIKD